MRSAPPRLRHTPGPSSFYGLMGPYTTAHVPRLCGLSFGGPGAAKRKCPSRPQSSQFRIETEVETSLVKYNPKSSSTFHFSRGTVFKKDSFNSAIRLLFLFSSTGLFFFFLCPRSSLFYARPLRTLLKPPNKPNKALSFFTQTFILLCPK